MNSRLRSRIIRIANASWGQIITAASALAAIRIYTEILTPTEFGVAMLALGGTALIDSISVMALNQTLLSRCGAIADTEKRRQLSIGLSWLFLKWALPSSILLGTAAAIPLLVLGYEQAWLVLPILLPTLILTETAKISLLSLVVLDQKHATYSTWVATEAILTVAITSTTLILWRSDAISLLAGNTLSRIICTGLGIIIICPKHFRGLDLKYAKGELLPALQYGAPIAIMGPLGWLSSYLDRYILGAILGGASTGVYVATTGLVSRPYALTSSVLSTYFRPFYFDSTLARTGAQGCIRILRLWLLTALGIGTIGIFAAILLGDWLASFLLAPAFREGASTLMTLFAISQTLSISTHAADNAILALRGSSQLLKAQIALSFSTLVLIPTGAFFFGVIGGLLGRCAAEAIKLISIFSLSMAMIRQRNGMAGVLTSRNDTQ